MSPDSEVSVVQGQFVGLVVSTYGSIYNEPAPLNVSDVSYSGTTTNPNGCPNAWCEYATEFYRNGLASYWQFFFWTLASSSGNFALGINTSQAGVASASMVGFVVAGVDTVHPVDTAVGGTGASLTASATLSTTNRDEKVLGILSTETDVTVTPTGTLIGEMDDGFATISAAEFYTQATPGSVTTQYNITDAPGWALYAIALVGSLTVGPYALPNPTQEGALTTFYAGDSGGVGPYKYVWSGLPTDCQEAALGESFGCAPAVGDAGKSAVTLSETDSAGSTAPGSFTWTVEPALVATLGAAPSTTEVGVPSVLTLGFTGGVAPVTWTLKENGSVMNLSGVSGGRYTFTPTLAGTYTFYLNATDALGSVSDAMSTVIVHPLLRATLSPRTATTQAGGRVTFTPILSGGVTPIRWRLETSGSLANLTADTFTPAAAGTYTIYLNATDAVGGVSNATSSVTVEPALVATLSANPSTTQVGEMSVLTLGFSGGVMPITWTLTKTGSAANLTGASETYTFTPVGTGSYTFYLNATDEVGSVSDVTATVTVEAALAASLTAVPNPTEVGVSSVLAIVLSLGVAPYSWTLNDGATAVDAGSASSATYTFTPAAAGTHTFYLNATDAVGSVSDVTATVAVEAALAASLTAVPNPTEVGASSVLTVGFTGGVMPVGWALQQGGVTVASGTGASTYRFTPAAAGTCTFYLNATDAVGSTSTVMVTITVDTALSSGSVSASPPSVGVRQTSNISTTGATGGAGGYTYSWTGLPPGCADPGSVMWFDCTPTAVGAYPITLTVTDANGTTATGSVVLTVHAPSTYTVTFTESGLPSGTGWWVNVTGLPSASSTSSTIGMNLSNGTYHFSATAGPDYLQWPVLELLVNGAPVNEAIPFPPTGFDVTFTLVGQVPPSTTAWWLNLSDGLSLESHGESLPFVIQNGTYSWTIASGDKRYSPVEPRGQLTVRGQPVEVNVTIALVEYSVTFVETGLPSGANWTVILEGSSNSSTSNSITFAEPNGSYLVSVDPPGGFSVGSFPETLNVTGANVSELIHFSGPPEFAGLTEEEWDLGLVIAVVVVLAVIFVVRRSRRKRRNESGEPPSSAPRDGAH